MKKLVALPGPKLVKDRAWERTVDTLIGNRVDRAVSQVLFEMAEESRKQGYWNRWQACLGRIVRIHPNEGVAEEAWRQMIVYSGSQEVQHAVRTLHKQEFESNDSSEQHSAVALGSVPPASPFERGATNGGGNTRVELANFQATQDADSFYAVQAMAVESQWNIVDSRALQWVDKQMRQKNPYMGADPRIQLPLAAQKFARYWHRRNASRSSRFGSI